MRKNNKGFTLLEMLIVVAIIAVLVAIAIPTMTSALEKSREAVDAANIRNAYSEVMIMALTQEFDATDKKIGNNVLITGVATVGSEKITATITATQKQAGWQTPAYNEDGAIAGFEKADAAAVVAPNTWTLEYTESTGVITISAT